MEERKLKGKIIVLLVCMALLVGVLSGCIEDEEEEPTPTNNAPVASFTSSVAHNNTTAGGTVTFTDASTDADGDTLTYSWVFGDTTTNTTQNPSHTYAANGTYTVALTVSDGTDTGTKSASVIVGNVAPTADFTSVATNLSVNFTDASTDPNIGDTLTWSWNFGDDSALNTTQNPIYAYAAAGTYNVTLTVTDTYGLTDVSDITEITVTA